MKNGSWIKNSRTESAIEAMFNREVAKYGGLPRKYTSPGRNGVPDRLVMWPGGLTTYAEVKKDDGELSPAQVDEIALMRNLGQLVAVIRTELDVAKFIAESRRRMQA